MKEFNEVVKMKIVPTTFVFHCTLCGLEMTHADRHFGLISMNEHILASHADEVNSIDKELLYSRKPQIRLDSY